MFLDEGTAYDYVKDTLDPIPSTALLKDGAYHYLLVRGWCFPKQVLQLTSGCADSPGEIHQGVVPGIPYEGGLRGAARQRRRSDECVPSAYGFHYEVRP